MFVAKSAGVSRCGPSVLPGRSRRAPGSRSAPAICSPGGSMKLGVRRYVPHLVFALLSSCLLEGPVFAAEAGAAVHSVQVDPAAQKVVAQAPGAAVAQSAGPAKAVDAKSIVQTRVASSIPEDVEGDEPLSDINSAVLRDMKQQAYVAPGLPALRPENFSVRQDSAAALPQGNTPDAPPSLLNFAGVSDADQLDGFIHTPPDANIAVGPNHVVLLVNSLIA